MALELHRSCASSSRVEWSTHHRGAMHGELLNPAWTRHLPCKYGELPGMWLPYMGPTIQDFGNLHGTHVARGDGGIPISNVTHGSGWQLFEPACQLHNYLHDYLMYKEPVVPEARKNIKILFIGDSVDRHPIIWYTSLLVSYFADEHCACSDLPMPVYGQAASHAITPLILQEILHNQTSGPNATNILKDRNYNYNEQQFIVEPGNGLDFYYGSLGSQFANDDDELGVKAVCASANNLRGGPLSSIDPDVVMINEAFWDLKDMGSNSGFDKNQMVMSPAYVQR